MARKIAMQPVHVRSPDNPKAAPVARQSAPLIAKFSATCPDVSIRERFAVIFVEISNPIQGLQNICFWWSVSGNLL